MSMKAKVRKYESEATVTVNKRHKFTVKMQSGHIGIEQGVRYLNI